MATAAVKQHVPIFISSTYEDLIPYREEVQRQLIRLEQIVKGMEYFGSSPKDSLSVCLSQVRESRVFIGILGMRYGSVDEDTGQSYTQLEYNEAIKCGIPTLMYIIDENQPVSPKNIDFGDSAKSLAEFKALVKKRHTVSFFTTPDDLGQKIANDLVETLSALGEVKVEEPADPGGINGSFVETYKKYLLRPAKYSGAEGMLYFKIDAERTGSTLKEALIRGLGLEIGDTVSNHAYVLNEDKKTMPSDRRVSVYADKECADWLEQANVGNIVRARVKLAYCSFKEIVRYDGGSILKENLYLGLIIVEGISIE